MWLDDNTYQLESGIILSGVELINYFNLNDRTLMSIEDRKKFSYKMGQSLFDYSCYKSDSVYFDVNDTHTDFFISLYNKKLGDILVDHMFNGYLKSYLDMAEITLEECKEQFSNAIKEINK